jgi:hypothetical protein
VREFFHAKRFAFTAPLNHTALGAYASPAVERGAVCGFNASTRAHCDSPENGVMARFSGQGVHR